MSWNHTEGRPPECPSGSHSDRRFKPMGWIPPNVLGGIFSLPSQNSTNDGVYLGARASFWRENTLLWSDFHRSLKHTGYEPLPRVISVYRGADSGLPWGQGSCPGSGVLAASLYGMQVLCHKHLCQGFLLLLTQQRHLWGWNRGILPVGSASHPRRPGNHPSQQENAFIRVDCQRSHWNGTQATGRQGA